MAMRALAALLLVLLTLAGCSSPPPVADRIDLNSTVPLPPETDSADSNSLRVAIAAVISPRETLIYYRELLDYLSEHVGRPIQLIQRATYAEVNDLVRAGEVDLAFVCTWAYVDGRDSFGMELLAAPQVAGKAVYYSYLLVPAESKAESLLDLRGGVFAFTDPLSTTGRLVPSYWLSQEGLTPETFFRQTIYTYSHDRAIMAVADGLVDGAAVDHLVYETMAQRNPTLTSKVRVIRRSVPIGTPPVVMGPDVDQATKEAIRGLLTQMHLKPEGQQILEYLEIERWVMPPADAYDPIVQMLETMGRPGP